MNEIQKNKINRKLNNNYEIEIKALTEKINSLKLENLSLKLKIERIKNEIK